MSHSVYVLEIVTALISVIQVFLLVFTFGLAREVFVLKTQREGSEAWPLLKISPGETLPAVLLNAMARLSPASRESALIVCAINTEGLQQMLASLSIACSTWSRELLLICETEHLTTYCSVLTKSTRELNIVPNLGTELGLSANTILFAQNGRVVEASSLSRTPASIRDRFYFVAE